MFEKIKCKVYELATKFLTEEKGAETMEYVAIAAVVITLGVLGYNTGAIQTVISTGLNQIQTQMSSVG